MTPDCRLLPLCIFKKSANMIFAGIMFLSIFKTPKDRSKVLIRECVPPLTLAENAGKGGNRIGQEWAEVGKRNISRQIHISGKDRSSKTIDYFLKIPLLIPGEFCALLDDIFHVLICCLLHFKLLNNYFTY